MHRFVRWRNLSTRSGFSSNRSNRSRSSRGSRAGVVVVVILDVEVVELCRSSTRSFQKALQHTYLSSTDTIRAKVQLKIPDA